MFRGCPWRRVWAAHASQERGEKGLGRVKTKHEKGFGFFKVPKSGVGRVWRWFNARLNNTFLLLRCVGKSNLPLEMGLPWWGIANTEESPK